MKSQSPHLILVSCYQSDLPEVGNVHNHLCLLDQLRLLSVPYTEILGRHNGKNERGIMLGGEYKRVAEMILREYNQSCYLEHHNDRSCELVYSNGARDKIGVMKEVPKEQALTKDSFTFIPETGRYFVAE